MSKILWGLGIIAAAAGLWALGYGALHNGGDLGNTLIIAGATAFVGGLILIALAEAVRQLHRIAEGLMARPVSRAPRDMFEPIPEAEAPVAPAAPRIPFPPKVEPRKRALAAEPRLEVAPSIDSSGDHFDRPEPAFGRHAPDPRVIPEREEAPSLSPAAPRFSATRMEEKDELAEGLLATAFSRLDV